MKAMTNSPMSSNLTVVSGPSQLNRSQAAKNRLNPAHPASTIKRRRLFAIGAVRVGYIGNLPSPAILKVLVRSLIGLRQRRHSPPPPLRGRAGWDLLPSFADGDLEFLELARPNDADRLRCADFGLSQSGVQVLEATRRGAVEGNQRIALHQAGFVGRTLRLDRDDQQAAVLLCLRLHRFGQRDFLGPNAQVGAPNPSVGLEAGDHPLRDVHRNRAPVATPEDPAIHADGSPVDIDQRTTAEPWIQRRVGLDQMLDLAAPPAAPGGRNRADRPEGRLQAPWTPDRQHDLSRTQ